MKRIVLTYTGAEVRPAENRETFFAAARSFIAARLPGGYYPRRIASARRLNGAARSKGSRAYLRCCILSAVLGNRLTCALFGKTKRTADGYADALPGYGIPYRGRYLYHFAEEGALESIRAHGLVPGSVREKTAGKNTAGKKYVYLTDDPVIMGWFPAWKTEWLKRDTVFCLLKIDARSAAKKHRLIYSRANEIVADGIGPEDIIWDG